MTVTGKTLKQNHAKEIESRKSFRLKTPTVGCRLRYEPELPCPVAGMDDKLTFEGPPELSAARKRHSKRS